MRYNHNDNHIHILAHCARVMRFKIKIYNIFKYNTYIIINDDIIIMPAGIYSNIAICTAQPYLPSNPNGSLRSWCIAIVLLLESY